MGTINPTGGGIPRLGEGLRSPGRRGVAPGEKVRPVEVEAQPVGHGLRVYSPRPPTGAYLADGMLCVGAGHPGMSEPPPQGDGDGGGQ